MRIHLSSHGEHEILQVAVIRRAEQDLPTGLEKRASCFEQIRRTIHVLDNIARNHEIEMPQPEFTIDQRFNKLDVRIRTSRNRYPTRRSIDSRNLKPQFGQSPGDMPIPTSEITNRSHSFERLHKLDENRRQLLAR